MQSSNELANAILTNILNLYISSITDIEHSLFTNIANYIYIYIYIFIHTQTKEELQSFWFNQEGEDFFFFFF